MTREEAIDLLGCIYMEVSTDEDKEAVDMAIEALQENESLAKSVNEASELLRKKRPHGECNQCRHYEGVHGVNGHAPCSFWGLGGVLSSDYCSRFEKEGE